MNPRDNFSTALVLLGALAFMGIVIGFTVSLGARIAYWIFG